jgi:copper chaperone
VRLIVEGITCGHCARSVKEAIASLGGTAQVDIGGGTVHVHGVSDPITVRAAIEREGYTVVSVEDRGAEVPNCVT